MTIQISQESQEIISQLKDKNNALAVRFAQAASEVETATLLGWLTPFDIDLNEEDALLLGKLNISLLKDLCNSKSAPHERKSKKKGGWLAKAKLGLLAVAGTVYFGCEGFDGISAIMGIFSSVPTFAIFLAGSVFAILSIVVFYSFDLVEISKNLGVKFSNSPKKLDILYSEFKKIKALRSLLSHPASKTIEQVNEDLQLAKMLMARHKDLDKERLKLMEALNNPYLRFGKMLTAGIAGVIFFSGGFFSGQTVALAIAGLFMGSVSAAFPPVLIASILVGLAAFSVYWFVERPGIENLISRWMHLDKNKIDALCDSEAVEQESRELDHLVNMLSENSSLKETKLNQVATIISLEERVSEADKIIERQQKTIATLQKFNQTVDEMPGSLKGLKRASSDVDKTSSKTSAANLSSYSFYAGSRRSRSFDDLRSLEIASNNM
ncbi:hypothetical protein [Legionella jordanis]|uniref:Coiled-coil protein n=1 Tax=Legionella jordanis TaxID=456 RepID=A0A0W0VD88_9GAMM|nr:hypothetical protein [Legionella jordanis]KTD18113.1 coiled-coil protein [Legionella jordanis]RMX00576.1 hypothetical protein EAW55_12505 [Legionella jordanis]RMX21308.1 hypothetical protein EAS68_03820 [Legionella jordanis]VEH13794.1 coiled-coil protein [Legionella jordanis]